MGSKVGAKREARSQAAAAIPVAASLRVLRGFYEGLEIPVDRDRIVIGRGRRADIVIPESTMSRQHAAVGYGEEGFFVEDLGSTNGTLVNGEAQKRAPLHDGDEIRLGKLHLQLRFVS
ncbi:MAG: FHA domain-containing protein [Deltaproteobacteria bacterium]|nr:MAG: FHA domain-containing protein [Deltaproteobacteria bacterium]